MHLALPAATWWLCAAPPEQAQAPPPEDPSWQPIEAPETVAAALRRRGEWSIDDPPHDLDARDWWFRARFDAPAGGGCWQLCAEGLATPTDAWLNDTPVLSSASMFTAHRIDVASLLRPTDNELLLRCRSITTELAQRRPRPRWRTPMVTHPQLRWIRTTLLGRTPGWSPPAPPIGPWRGIGLALPGPGIRLRADLESDEGVLHATLTGGHALESAELLLEHDGHVHRARLEPDGFPGDWKATLRVPAVQPWWPHTHGTPTVHAVRCRLLERDGTEHVRSLGAVGFRRIERAPGDGFGLRVNGVPVFCRGAVWTPLDPVSLRATPDAHRAAVAQACEAGLNMLRVAGTTVYEEDAFYAACDEAGVMVWQDFMFASMDYPLQDPGFAALAQDEVRQQLQRLAAHPCITVWCGNSEVEQQAAMWGVPRDQWAHPFFHETVPALCRELSPETPYWPSSAHGGAFPHQADTGTTSYYGVGAYQRPLEDARRSGLRFATECLAFANVPPARTLARLPGGEATRAHHPHWKARSPRDLGAGWDFDDVRDHYVATLFGVNPARLRYSDHERYLALGRLATAEAMQAAFAEWRRPGSSCGGALVLCLRDFWAGAGWGVVDEAGQPKAPWHALRRTLQPVTAFFTDEGLNGLAVHVLNDRPEARAVRLELTAWRDGQVRVAQATRDLELGPHEGTTLPGSSLFDRHLDLGWAWRFGPPLCDAVSLRLLAADGTPLAHALHFPTGPGLDQRPQPDIGLSATATLHDRDTATLTLRTARVAVGVCIELEGWRAMDDHFHLAPEAPRAIALRRTEAVAGLRGTVGALNTSQTLHLDIGP